MTKTKAIKTYCFECAGESNKEVTLCSAFDCPLWDYRTGAKAGTKVYLNRMAAAKANYPGEYSEFEMGLENACFSERPSSKQRSVAGKSARTGKEAGK